MAIDAARRKTPTTQTKGSSEAGALASSSSMGSIRAYRDRVKQCEALLKFAVAEEIREILRQEQEHAIDLATALGEDVPAT